MPLVINMSFGVGNEVEGQARIDHLFDSTLARHPDVVFTVSAGNDGPGLSTLDFPGSATRVIPVGALFPGVFLAPDDGGPVPPNSIADFSARGGEVAGPDLVTPGVAYSTVPLWNRGGEREGGTSMASPHAAGLAARLLSGAQQDGKSPTAWAIRQALMVTAQPLEGATFVDEGTGLPNISRAWSWLHAHPEMPFVAVTTAVRHQWRVSWKRARKAAAVAPVLAAARGRQGDARASLPEFGPLDHCAVDCFARRGGRPVCRCGCATRFSRVPAPMSASLAAGGPIRRWGRWYAL